MGPSLCPTACGWGSRHCQDDTREAAGAGRVGRSRSAGRIDGGVGDHHLRTGGPPPARSGGASWSRGRPGHAWEPAGPGLPPGVRAADGSKELPVAAYELFFSTDPLGQIASKRMLAKLSSRRDEAGRESVGAEVIGPTRSALASAVPRRFVKATEAALGKLLTRGPSGLDLVALMSDGFTSASTATGSLWRSVSRASTAPSPWSRGGWGVSRRLCNRGSPDDQGPRLLVTGGEVRTIADEVEQTGAVRGHGRWRDSGAPAAAGRDFHRPLLRRRRCCATANFGASGSSGGSCSNCCPVASVGPSVTMGRCGTPSSTATRWDSSRLER